MVRNTIMLPKDFKSSFLSVEKDIEIILRKLFVESQPYSDELKKLLAINMKDCIDDKNNELYNERAKELTLPKLIEEGYIKVSPQINLGDHEEMRSYIVLSIDNFSMTSNDEFRDCYINFDILCNPSQWDLGNFRVRPLKIAGYIDGILNKQRLTGIGLLEFAGCETLVLDENFQGYTLSYRAVHGFDDRIPPKEI